MVMPSDLTGTLWMCETCLAEWTSVQAAIACEDAHEDDQRRWSGHEARRG